MSLAEVLRECVLADASISEASRGAGVPQPTLQEFAVGRPDGSFADIRLSSAQKLINYYGINKLGNVPQVVPKRSRRMLLSAELEASECQDSPEKFKERLIDGIVVQFPGQTIDGLLCSPLDALAYCDRIREGVGSECLADSVQCPLTAVQFREMVVDTLAGMYRDRTIDELVCQPREARMLCNAVRQQSRCDSIKDQLVLSTLMNVRKAG